MVSCVLRGFSPAELGVGRGRRRGRADADGRSS